MTLSTAPSDPTTGVAAGTTVTGGGTVLLLAAIVTLGYLLACATWPYRACRRCAGAGKFRSPTGRAWRRCPTCSGSGARLRFGRRVWNVLARYRHARKAHRAREHRYGTDGRER